MRKWKYLVLLLPFAIIFISVSACRTVNTVTSNGTYSFTQIGDYLLDNQIKVQDIKIVDSENSRTFNVLLKNLMWFDLNLEIKMDFFDKNGIKVDNPWGYKPVKIENGQTEWVKFLAPSKKTEKFKLFIKLANEGG